MKDEVPKRRDGFYIQAGLYAKLYMLQMSKRIKRFSKLAIQIGYCLKDQAGGDSYCSE
jgi:hypothetical protein